MEPIEAIVLAVIQGLTEFLPVSSSGHLALAHWLLGGRAPIHTELPLEYVVLVHFGTLLAVVLYYAEDFAVILRDIFRGRGSGEGRRPRGWGRKVGWLLVVATVPAAVVGVLFKGYVEALFNVPWVVGISLLITGTILLVGERVGQRNKSETETTLLDAFVVGVGQAVAIVPGISRSGSTIATGLGVGLTPEWSPRFAFLMSVPIILGGTVYEVRDLLAHGAVQNLALYSLCGLISAVFGYLAIRLVINAVRAGNLKYFAAYCYMVGILAIVVDVYGLL